LQPLDDLGPGLRIGSGGQRDARHAGKPLVQHRQLDIFGAEVVPPLRHAVRLVDGEERDPAVLQQCEAALGQEPLRRHVNEVELAFLHTALDGRGLGAAQCGIEKRGAHPQLGQRVDLVLHQRDQRRDHDADAVAEHRRDLVAQRLAPSGWHQHQRIAAARKLLDRFGLVPAERGVAEHVVEDRKSFALVVQGIRFVRISGCQPIRAARIYRVGTLRNSCCRSLRNRCPNRVGAIRW
jgi:hypothetical protein